ncbi:hypothetical protein A3762_18415 [Oleiphilus sp. HI0125]|uniref:AAA family ATPase n=1 Tax=Oleiphilus sp. HI0125 TaxID=1822266 RepID=UPI0007C2F97F|nr:hypothetical protein [Oleiphilus sp. HI0125]KZZ57804.1 hypothetical protein A3762_01015 [Oleiphilus sp. HI0125]KZZ58374.1 hypothetical protein A3762_18415 [Oleiphilus sp. HI0125]
MTWQMKSGKQEVQGRPKSKRTRLRLGFAGDDFSYAISLFLPTRSRSAFALDPEIKKECIWAGERYYPARVLIDRDGPILKSRSGRSWDTLSTHIPHYETSFSHSSDPQRAPEIIQLRDKIDHWHFYDHFRTDSAAPGRQSYLGSRTTILSDDGHDLAAALQTVIEIGNEQALYETIEEAFYSTRLDISRHQIPFMLNARFM